jgi:thiol-disulfide isomerase/thioredoxin
MSTQKAFLLGIVLAAIVGLILYLGGSKSSRPGANTSGSVSGGVPEITNPSGFVNSEPFKLSDLIGKKVIIVDFWTYSCINCQRTLPYINAWYEKYKDNGLEIVGIHTPEFDFEKELNNVQAAVDKYQIKYPVVLDNDYSTWGAYQNRYWPHKFLIDINGKIVYDHIGEGGYEETEAKIQELLKERPEKFGDTTAVESDMTKPANVIVAGRVGSPEVYFGAGRNEYLANGKQGTIGEQIFTPPAKTKLNELYLGGTWNIQNEFSQNTKAGDKILFRYSAKNVYMVASSESSVEIVIKQDGKVIKTITVKSDDLYSLIQNPDAGEHELEIEVKGAGLKAFTFTFG